MHDLVSIDMKPVFVAIMRTFVKQQYDSHALFEEEEVGTHGIIYGLTKPDLSMPVHKKNDVTRVIFPVFGAS